MTRILDDATDTADIFDVVDRAIGIRGTGGWRQHCKKTHSFHRIPLHGLLPGVGMVTVRLVFKLNKHRAQNSY